MVMVMKKTEGLVSLNKSSGEIQSIENGGETTNWTQSSWRAISRQIWETKPIQYKQEECKGPSHQNQHLPRQCLGQAASSQLNISLATMIKHLGSKY